MTCVALLAGVIAGVLLLASTAAGLRILLDNVGPLIPGRLEVAGVSGSLYTGAHFDTLDYTLPGTGIAAADVELRLNWLALVAGELRFSRLSVARLQLTRDATAAAGAEGLPEVDLPFGLRVVDGRVQVLELANGDFGETATDVTLDAALRGSRLRVFAAAGQSRGVRATVTGELRFTGDWPLAAEVVWTAASPRALSGRGSVAGDLRRLLLEQVVAVPDEVQLSATIDAPLEALRYSAQLRWSALTVPLDAGPLTLRDGDITVAGDLTAYSATVAAEVGVGTAPPARVALVAAGDFAALRLTKIAARLLDGTVSGTGALVFASRDLTLDLSVADLNPGALVPGWLEPVSGRIALSVTGTNVVTTTARLVAGDNVLNYMGEVAPAIRGSVVLEAADLAQLYTGAAGELTVRGSVGGSLQEPAAELAIAGRSLGWDSLALGSLRAQLNTAAEGDLQISLLAQEAGASGSDRYNLQLTAVGRRAQFAYRARGRGPTGAAAVAGSGSWSDAQLELQAATAELSPPVGPAWSLAEPLGARIALAAEPEATIEPHCWRAQPASLCLVSGTLSAASLAAVLRLRDLPLAWLVPPGANDLSAEGRADADLIVSGSLSMPSARLVWTQHDTRLATRDADGNRITLALPRVGARLQLQDDALILDGQLSSGEQLSVTVAGSVRHLRSPAPALAINVAALIPDIAVASPLLEPFTGLRDLSGRARVDMQFSGTPDAPTVTGEAQLTQAGAVLPLTGIALTDIALSARGSGLQRVVLDGSARSGDGEIRLSGDLGWLDEQFFADLKLTGQDFTALRFPGQQARVSPDLRLAARGNGIDITGTVEIPYADITIERLPETAVARSGDVVIVRDTQAETPAGTFLQVSSDIDVRLGDAVRLQAFGLQTGLAGALKLRLSPASAEPVVEGNLQSVDGSFEAYGREFRIERGVLIFAGVADNPAVNVRAVRELEYDGQDIKIGVQLTGTLEQLQTRLFGEPAMSESDALAYLILNRPMQRSDSLASEQLSGAAVALGLANMLPVTEQLRDTLGLDEIEFAGMTRESSVVTAGKRIGDDFYIRYTYGLFERIGRFVIRYDIGRGFSLEAGSGQEQTIDLLYSVDR
jgi:translocation and assembly module TamB